MSLIYDLTTLTCLTMFTGSGYSNGNSRAVSVISPTSIDVTGSWGGLANTWGVETLAAAEAASGSWGGVAYSNGVQLLVTESYDRVHSIADGSPNTNQSIGPGAWNTFPIPAAPEPIVTKERDATRFRKSYSSQRMQPRKIRIVKR